MQKKASLVRSCLALTVLGAAAFVVLVPGGVAGRLRGQQRPASTRTRTRCCFEVSITGGLQFIASYSSGDPNDPTYPNGAHTIHADWHAEQLVRYGESGNGTPILIGILGGGARVKAVLREDGLWNLAPPQEPINGHRYVSTEPKQFDSNPKHGWLASRTFVTFVGSGKYIHVGPGPAIWSTFTKCGAGISYHGRNAAQSSWDGLNGPWQWVLKGPTRSQFRHDTQFFDVLKREQLPDHTHTGPGGVLHRVYGPAGDSILVVFRYFPETKIRAEIASIKARYPITSPGFRALRNDCPP